MPNNTVPMLVADAMTREGLSEADTVYDTDANSVAVSLTLLGFSVRNRAGRFDFIETDGTLHPRGYKTRGPVTSWARKRAAKATPGAPISEAAPVDEIPDPVADAQEAQDKDAEAFRVKATRAHDRVVKGHKRVMAAHERAHAALTRAEAARERAEAAEATESERAYVRVAEADALMWTNTPGATEYRHAFGAFVSARFDAEFLPVSEACAEAYAYAEAAEAATGTEYENGDGKDVPGVEQCAEDADHARKETKIEYGVFEPSPWSGKWSASRFDAETGCDLICAHARDMAAAVRHAEAAAEAAEAAAEQAEAWADAAEEQTDTAEYESDALFALGADDAQRALARAYWGVSDVVAEEAAENAAEAAERAPSPVAVAVAAPVAAERPAQAEWPAVMVPAGVARWESQEAEGAPLTVAGPRGEVQVWYAGYWDVCWGHCPMQHAHKGGTCGCAHVLRPVLLCDGEGESYTWQDCPECMARELKTDVDTVWSLAPEGARADVVRASVVAESWYVAEEWEGGRTPDGANLDARETAAVAVADVEATVRALESTPGATMGALETSLYEVREAARVVESWADHVWEVDRENARRAEAAERQTTGDVATPEMGTCTEPNADVAPEGEAADDTPEAAPVATGPKVVPVAETVRRARTAQADAEAVMWDAQTSVNDLAETYGKRESLRLSWDQEEGLRKSLAREREAAARATQAAFQARVTADSWQRDSEHAAADMDAMRARTARLFSGEGDGRSRWVSADGRTVIALALPAAADAVSDVDARYADVLAGAIAAKDSGRVLKSTGIPNKKTHARGPGADFKSAVVRASQPLVNPWKAPRIPSEGKPLMDDALSGFADAGDVVAETEAAPGVWLPMAAVRVADTAGANGWTVAMERHEGGSVVIVRAAGVIERKGRDGETATVAGECVAVFEGGQFNQARSGALVGIRYVGGATLSQVLTTVGQAAKPGHLVPVTVTPDSAPAPAGVSDPGSMDTWETDGGACPGVDQPGAPDAGRDAAPVDADPSPEMSTCTAPATDVTPVRPDVVSDPGAVGTWDGEGGAVPGVVVPAVRLTPGERVIYDGPSGIPARGVFERYSTYGRAYILRDGDHTPVLVQASDLTADPKPPTHIVRVSVFSGGGTPRAGYDPRLEDTAVAQCSCGWSASATGGNWAAVQMWGRGHVESADASEADRPAAADTVSDPGMVDAWDGEGGAVPRVEQPRVHPGDEQQTADGDTYAVRPAVPEWTPVPDGNSRITELTCAGRQYRVYHAPDAVLPYTVRYTLGGADVDLGGWVGLDDVYAIVRADRRRSAALEAERGRVEQQRRRAAYRLQGERRQAPVRLTEETRLAIARRAEEKHRPVAAELYVSPVTGNAVLAFVCGTCATTHDDPLWRPQTIGGSYRTPLSVERATLTALVEKHGWTITGTWTAHGTRGDTMRAWIAPTEAYLAWVDTAHGPDPATPEVEAGERITRAQRGWWDVISKEGHRYELTWRPTLTGPVWSVRRRGADGFETVATTGLAGTVLMGMRVDSAERGNQPADEGNPESVHVPLAS
ncbi:hypothetical protein P2Q00_42990 [Streptomyces coacervatus]|nr:hypothetical protein [Streptomyces coacervatus]MDF2272133.1 hypothetical protein [Streptomyces coacervatus]